MADSIARPTIANVVSVSMTQATDRPAPSAERRREGWVDAAKGIAIILVVLFHAVIFLNDIGLAGPWGLISGPLDTFRMPLFFFTAGLFARKALRFTLGGLVRARIIRFMWLYVLWTTIWALAFQFIPLHRDVDQGNPLGRWLLSLVWPNESTWFVYALALYFALAWILMRAPLWAQVTIALLLAVIFGADIVNSGNLAVDKMGTYFVFFLLAVHTSPQVMDWARRDTWWRAGALAMIYAAATGVSILFGIQRVPGVRLLSGIIAIAFGVSLAAALARYNLFRWLLALGKRTLPVYFVHFYVVLGGVAVLAEASVDLVPTFVWVPVLTGLGIILPLVVERATRHVRWLWNSPFPTTRK